SSQRAAGDLRRQSSLRLSAVSGIRARAREPYITPTRRAMPTGPSHDPTTRARQSSTTVDSREPTAQSALERRDAVLTPFRLLPFSSGSVKMTLSEQARSRVDGQALLQRPAGVGHERKRVQV